MSEHRRARRVGVATAVAATLTVSLVAPSATAQAARATTTRAVSHWSATAPALGSAAAVTGTVKDRTRKRRTVLLQQRLPSGWRTVSRDKTSRSGTYVLRIPTGWSYTTAMRVKTLPVRGSKGDVSRARTVQVDPGYTPLGAKSAWAPLSTEHRFRWNPCETITYRVNTTGAPVDSLEAVKQAVALTAQGTGMRFKYTGATDAIPGSKRAWPGDTDLVIAWATPEQTTWDLASPTVAARGGSIKAVWGKDARGKVAMITRGGIAMDATTGQTSEQNVHLLMHEMTHVVGLNHVADPLQYGSGDPTMYTLGLKWGAGDYAGFQRVGLAAGCVKPIRR